MGTKEAIDWLMDDKSGNSVCENFFFVERYALNVMSFSAPFTIEESLLPELSQDGTQRQCLWSQIVCHEGSVVSLIMPSDTIAGSIATELGLLTNLETLISDGTMLTGTIPSEIGLLTNLVKLELDTNKFAGTIPTEIGLLTNLVELEFDENKLTGTIPTEIGLL